MIDVITMVAVFLAGLLLGGFFFGCLLWTVERGLSAEHPVFWFIGSYLVRIAVILGGFYLVSAGRWDRMTLCAAGFFMARILLIRFASTLEQTCSTEKKADNAS